MTDDWIMHDPAMLRAFGRLPGVGLRVKIPLKEHRRRRVQKKWNRRYGIMHLSISSETIGKGWRAVRDEIRAVRRLGLDIHRGKVRPEPFDDHELAAQLGERLGLGRPERFDD